MSSALLLAADETRARDALLSMGCTDGLPVVPPTIERVAEMALLSELDLDITLGAVPPRGGGATVEMIAANAVMAGCAPHHFPVLLAAVRAMLDPAFDLALIQSTTNGVFPGIIVNGPARDLCGPIASGCGALGPGYHANSAIGRALRLILFNLGGGTPGTADMALLGVGKFACCFAEAEDESPFEPLHAWRGIPREQSAVTLVGMDPPQAVTSAMHYGDDEAWAEALLDLLADTLAHPGIKGAYGGKGWPLIILNPDHARLLARRGYGRDDILEILAARATRRVGTYRRLNPELVEITERKFGTSWSDEVEICSCPADRTLLVVAGGAGNYSFVSHTWQGGPNGTQPITLAFEPNPICEL